MKFLFAVLAFLLIEIAGFVVIGGMLGLWLTLGLVVLAGGFGYILLKGTAMMGPISMSRDLFEFRDPKSLMPHRVLVVIAAMLLMFPGFFSDAVGILLLIQPVRRALIRSIARRYGASNASADPIDGSWVEGQPASTKPTPKV